MAALLAEHRVPVAVLNACQSAMQIGQRGQLAQRLAEAGVPVAVGMAYSVTVTAAEQAMPVLYRQLALGATRWRRCTRRGGSCSTHRARQAYFDQQLDLEDWVLPVAFAPAPAAVG